MQKKSSISAREIYRNKEKIIEELRDCITKAKEKNPEIKKAILFGSIARDDYGIGSDADVLLVLKSSPRERYFERIPDYLDYFLKASIPVEILPYTEAEIKRMLKNSIFMKRIMKEGIEIG